MLVVDGEGQLARERNALGSSPMKYERRFTPTNWMWHRALVFIAAATKPRCTLVCARAYLISTLLLYLSVFFGIRLFITAYTYFSGYIAKEQRKRNSWDFRLIDGPIKKKIHYSSLILTLSYIRPSMQEHKHTHTHTHIYTHLYMRNTVDTRQCYELLTQNR
jgi:hypothetical protein